MISRSTLIKLSRARDRLREPADVTVADVAKDAGFSPYHFIRLFDGVFGATPHQYRIRARLEHAKRLLAAGNHSVTDVCFEVGFASLGTFSDLFARRVGAPPSAYRERFRTIAAVPALLRYQLYTPCFGLMAGSAGAAIFEKHSRVNLTHLHEQVRTLPIARQP